MSNCSTFHNQEETEDKLIDKPVHTPTMSEPKYRCPSCIEGGMCRNETIVLCSYPPQFQYECNKCGHIDVHWG